MNDVKHSVLCKSSLCVFTVITDSAEKVLENTILYLICVDLPPGKCILHLVSAINKENYLNQLLLQEMLLFVVGFMGIIQDTGTKKAFIHFSQRRELN